MSQKSPLFRLMGNDEDGVIFVMERRWDTAVIGGGLSGLTAAIYAARGGARVALFEKANRFGGRAQTELKNGVHLNLGAHALYKSGEALRILQELGIEPEGGMPGTRLLAYEDDATYLFPTKPLSLLLSDRLSWLGKSEFVKLMAGLSKIRTDELMTVTLQDWVEHRFHDNVVKRVVYALCRTWTYGNEPHLQSAGAVIKQGQMAMKSSVLYVNRGWGTIVAKLRSMAEAAGVALYADRRVSAIRHLDGRVQSIELADGDRADVSAVVLTTSPEEAVRLVEGGERTVLDTWSRRAVPVKAACLDIGLRRLPKPHQHFALGMDEPLYYSNHSGAAMLSEHGIMVIHLIKYHGTSDPADARQDELRMERMLDSLQPGWREELAARRYMPNITVSHDLSKASDYARGAAVPTVDVPGIRGLYVAGDWVGLDGMIADRAMNSAKQAALRLLSGSLVNIKE